MLIFSLIFLTAVSFVVVNADKNEISNSTAAIDLFAIMMKLMSKAITETAEGSVNLAYTCSKTGSIPISFHSDSNGMPFVLCENVRCLESSKIECSPNVSLELCKGENNQWINGFHERFENGKNSTKVECCQYKDGIKMQFLKKINVTNVATFEREESYDGEKLVALTVFNDVEMHGNDKNETYYSVSVYQMFCPGITVLGKNVIRKTNTNEFIKNEKADALKNLASSAREIGLKIKNAKPKPKSSFDVQDPLLSFLASKYANNRNLLDNSAIDGKQHTKWTPVSRDIMAEPSYRVVSGSRYPYHDDEIVAGKLKWDIYNPKKSTQKQHIFSNIPYDFSDDNVVVTKIQ